MPKSGELTVNGHELGFWKNMRSTLLNGDKFQLCSSRADAVLNEISFLSGKNFSIVAGETRTTLKGPIRGKSLQELLQSLSEAAKIEIAEL